MRVVLILPLVLSAMYGALGARLARRLPPAVATLLLAGGGLVASACGVVALALLGFIFLAQLPEIAQRGHWSAAAFRAESPVSRGAAFAALSALGVVTLAAVWVAARRAWAVRSAYKACRSLPDSTASGFVVVDDDGLQAYAVPGRPGRIVVSRELLRSLTPEDRRVILAHEQAHLDLSHHWYKAATAVAAALNPLLTPLVAAVDLSLERWADESAAAHIGSRARVAAAIGRVALLRLHPDLARPPAALGGTGHVATRMQAMLEPPPRPRRAAIVLILASLVLMSATTADAGRHVDAMVDTAGSAACPGSDGLRAPASTPSASSHAPGHRVTALSGCP